MATTLPPFVTPALNPAVVEDNALEDLFSATLAGITGLTGDLVRPRWQPEPPNQPAFTTNWMAFGVQVMPADRFVYLSQIDANTCQLQCNEELKMLCSFYGPNSSGYAGVLRDGLAIEQNRTALWQQQIKLVEVLDGHQVPALFKQVWTKRVDMQIRWRRWVVRQYPVNSIQAAAASYLDNEHYLTPINTSVP